MTAEFGPEVDVEEVLRRVRSYASGARALLAALAVPPSSEQTVHEEDHAGSYEVSAECELSRRDQLRLPLPTGATDRVMFTRVLESPRCRFRDLVAYDDRTFVEAAYQAVLRRPADPEGAEAYVGHLRKGKSKAEIVKILQESPEGRRIGASMRGLSRSLLAQRMCSWPVIGRLVAIALALWDLPGAVHRRSRLEGELWARSDQIYGTVRHANQLLNEAFSEVHADISKLQAGLRRAVSQINASVVRLNKTKATADDLARLCEAVRGVQESKADRVALDERLRETDGRLTALADSCASAAGLLRIQQSVSAVSLQRRSDEQRVNLELARVRTEIESVRDEASATVNAGLHDLQARFDDLLQSHSVTMEELQAAVESLRLEARADVKAGIQDLQPKLDELMRLLRHRVTPAMMNAAVASLRVETGGNLQAALAEMRATLSLLSESKVDRVTLETSEAKAKEDMDACLGSLHESILALSRTKADFELVRGLRLEVLRLFGVNGGLRKPVDSLVDEQTDRVLR